MNIESILDFWFGTDPDDAVVAKEKSSFGGLKIARPTTRCGGASQSCTIGDHGRAKRMAGNRHVGLLALIIAHRSIPAQYLSRFGPSVCPGLKSACVVPRRHLGELRSRASAN